VKQMRLDNMFAAKRRDTADSSVRLLTDSTEASSATCDVPCSRNTDPASRSRQQQQQQQQQSSVPERIKVETTYVADSMATDSCRYSDSETNLFDDSPVQRRTIRNTKQTVDTASVSAGAKGDLSSPAPVSRETQLSSISSSLQEMPTLLIRKTAAETPASCSVNRQETVPVVSCAYR
jgi:hypothetical protein